MIAPDYRISACGVPMEHDSHVFHYMANGIYWTAQCQGKQAPAAVEPRCSNGNQLKNHTRPCGPGCEYPTPVPKETR